MNRQRGFTAIELLFVAAISSLMGVVLVGFIYSLFFNSTRDTTRVTAVTQIDTASRWFTVDVHQAQTTDLTDGSPLVSSIRMDWVDYTSVTGYANPDEFTAHYSHYFLDGTDLKRTFDGTTKTVARHISEVWFSLSGGLVTARLISSPEGSQWSTEARDYRVGFLAKGTSPFQ